MTENRKETSAARNNSREQLLWVAAMHALNRYQYEAAGCISGNQDNKRGRLDIA